MLYNIAIRSSSSKLVIYVYRSYKQHITNLHETQSFCFNLFPRKLLWIILYNIVIKSKFETGLKTYACKSYKQRITNIRIFSEKNYREAQYAITCSFFSAVVLCLTPFGEFLVIFLVDECKWRIGRNARLCGYRIWLSRPVHEVLSLRFLKQWPTSENRYWEILPREILKIFSYGYFKTRYELCIGVSFLYREFTHSATFQWP